MNNQHPISPEHQQAIDTTIALLNQVAREQAHPAAPFRETSEQRETQYTPPILVTEDEVVVLETVLPRNREPHTLTPPAENFDAFTLDKRTVETLEKAATAVALREPCLLEGDTATSKTSSIEYLAMLTNQPVIRLNLDGQTDTSDLIGRTVPSDGRLEAQFEELLAQTSELSPASQRIIERARVEVRPLTILESQQLAAAEGLKVPEWRWQDGALPIAMKQGYWLILDEINLAEPQILERLNPVLERHPTLTMPENGGATIGRGQTPLNPNFRIFATMNPASFEGRSRMSPAFKNRWLSYKFVERPTEEDYRAMLELIVHGEQPNVSHQNITYTTRPRTPVIEGLAEIEGIRPLLDRVAKFHSKAEEHARTNDIGRSLAEPYVFTRRDLLGFITHLSKAQLRDRQTGATMSAATHPDKIAERALNRIFIDRMTNVEDRDKLRTMLDLCQLSTAALATLLSPATQHEVQRRQQTFHHGFMLGDNVIVKNQGPFQFERGKITWVNEEAATVRITGNQIFDEQVLIHEILSERSHNTLPGYDMGSVVNWINSYAKQKNLDDWQGTVTWSRSVDGTKIVVSNLPIPPSVIHRTDTNCRDCKDYAMEHRFGKNNRGFYSLIQEAAGHRVLVTAETNGQSVFHLLDKHGVPLATEQSGRHLPRNRKRIRTKYLERSIDLAPENLVES